jgi:hypothetical protein
MYIPKRYGQSKVDTCPFCNERSIAVNSQGIPVCLKHKTAILNEMKCVCGKYLDLMTGKFGIFFNCINCGNINPKKVFEINIVKDVSAEANEKIILPKTTEKLENLSYKKPEKRKFSPGEITIRSDDPKYF